MYSSYMKMDQLLKIWMPVVTLLQPTTGCCPMVSVCVHTNDHHSRHHVCMIGFCPLAEFHGMWENLVYDVDVKEKVSVFIIQSCV